MPSLGLGYDMPYWAYRTTLIIVISLLMIPVYFMVSIFHTFIVNIIDTKCSAINSSTFMSSLIPIKIPSIIYRSQLMLSGVVLLINIVNIQNNVLSSPVRIPSQ